MRIVQITPGSGGGFYCENCLRDAALAPAMRRLGHDVILVPLYLPMRVDRRHQATDTPIFFGGLNVWLQQKFGLFRKTPRWVDRLFDSPWLLGWAARKAGMTSPEQLGQTVISMLLGEQGRQIKELERLIEWLTAEENRCELVCLSNILLAGLARRIKAALGVPVVCLLQDEHGFLDGLRRPYSQQAWDILKRRCSDIDAFVAVSRYYGELMRDRLGLDRRRVRLGYVGIPLQEYRPVRSRPATPTVGFLSQMCPAKGLDTLVEAFITVKKNERLRTARLRVAGGHSPADKAFLGRIRRRLDRCGYGADVDFLSGFARDATAEFLGTLSVLSVPEKQPVAYGLYVLESLAAGVPVVQPRSGVFPELLELTGGGVLFEPNDPEDLARALEGLLLEPGYADKLGQEGRQAVFEKFDIDQTARDMMRIYEELAGRVSRG